MPGPVHRIAQAGGNDADQRFPELTMAEIEWNDDVHYLAEAERVGGGKMIMLRKASKESIYAVQGGLVWNTHPKELTPTGRRYTLTEVHDG